MSGDAVSTSSFTTPFGAIEPNVLLAGIEGIAVIWTAVSTFAGAPLLPAVGAWQWWYSVVVLFIAAGVLVLGLLVEGLADLVEHLLTRQLRGDGKGRLRPWYQAIVDLPPDWGPAQRWMWNSSQAFAEFGRRRMRIVVARNTAFCLAVLAVLVLVALAVRRPDAWLARMLLVTAVAAPLVGIYVWVWLRAHRAWNRAVRDAGELSS